MLREHTIQEKVWVLNYKMSYIFLLVIFLQNNLPGCVLRKKKKKKKIEKICIISRKTIVLESLFNKVAASSDLQLH